MSDSEARQNIENSDTSHKSNNCEKLTSSKLDESRLHYENGKCFYTDPSGERLEWNEEKQEWIRDSDISTKPNNDYILEDGCYYYKDKTTGKKFKWNTESNSWATCTEEGEMSNINSNIKTIRQENSEEENEDDEDEELEDEKPKSKPVVRQDMSEGIYGTDGENHTYTDPNDGTVYVWDKEKNAWFPKIDEDFLAQYQMSYGFVKPDSTVATTPKDETDIKKDSQENSEEDVKKDTQDSTSLKRKQPLEPAWFDVGDKHNTKVYVTNLPTDITEQEFIDLMQKCGLVMKDVETGKMKIKLYTEPGTDHLKGDALCTYIKVESVELALNLLDGYDFKGHKIHVERAKFTMKGNAYDPSLKPRKKRRKDKEKIKKMQEKLFDWRPDKLRGERSKHERVVIIKNLFEPSLFDKDVGLILEYQQDIREECLKCGDVRKVTIYDRHPEGIAQVIFKEPEAADACVQLLHYRWFGQRRISAEIWDGKTKYKIIESEEEKQERIKKWDSFLASKSEKMEESDNKGKKHKESNEDSKVDNEAEGSDSDTRSSAGSQDETDED